MLKCTAFFQQGSAGWSETWFRDGTSLSAGMLALQALTYMRVPMLHSSVSVIAYRVSVVENPAIVQSRATSYPGTATVTRDVTNAALLWSATTTLGVRRQVITRGMPDEVIVGGLYSGVNGFGAAANNWSSHLVQNSWAIRTQERTTNTLKDIAGVSSTGHLTTFADQVWAEGDTLKFFRTRDTTRVNVGGTWKIGSVVSAHEFVLVGWQAGRIVTGGRVRRYVLGLQPVFNVVIVKAFTRKTGRPFGSPVGRVKSRA